jgi:hypothetical protein
MSPMQMEYTGSTTPWKRRSSCDRLRPEHAGGSEVPKKTVKFLAGWTGLEPAASAGRPFTSCASAESCSTFACRTRSECPCGGGALGTGVAVFGSLRNRTRDRRRERLVLHLFGALLIAAVVVHRV